MKIALITPITPYKENRGGATGLPYHLLISRPKDIDVIIYSFNRNNLTEDMISSVEEELRVSIRLLDLPNWIKLIENTSFKFLRVFLKYPLNYYYRLNKQDKSEIEKTNPDVIWCYAQEFDGIAKQFPNNKRLHTLPDCYSLHFYRRLSLKVTIENFFERWNVILNYLKYYRMERGYENTENIVYHLVGEEDRIFLKSINPGLNSYFIHHPHYEISNQHKINFHKPKIKLLITGRYDLYCKQMADDLFELMCKIDISKLDFLRENYSITFLGKDWENHVENLKQIGYDVTHIKFAPDYIEEIIKHDIQLNPISIGTGTKGKVLDGLANGLLLLGTYYALENIAVEHGESCVLWKNPEEVPNILLDIINNREKYEQIAMKGREVVLTEHNPQKVSEYLFHSILGHDR